MEFKHISVMSEEVIRELNIREDGIYVDGTLGGAGHSSAIISMLGSDGRLIGIDQDADAIAASSSLIGSDERVTIVKSNYSRMDEVLAELDIEAADGILLDLGVSSHQFDYRSRGFSYHTDEPLDMRMDKEKSFTAADVVNTYSEAELKKILYEYGEEKYAASIAGNIIRKRSEHKIETTMQLVDIIRASMPEREKNKKGHPARKTFQALRIEVNSELDVLKSSIWMMIELLNPDGRLAIITFHSLEDRIVKKAFLQAEDPCICPKDFPVCTCGRKSKGRMEPHRPIVPTEDEIRDNPRSRSAKLRIFRKQQA